MIERTPRGPGRRALGAFAALAVLLAIALQVAPPAGGAPLHAPEADRGAARVVVVARSVLATMNRRFLESNEHWDVAPRMNSLTQMVRSGGRTQLEYLGCLQGRVSGDTVRIRDWQEARDLVRLQFGVDGDCGHVPDLLGTWHTHPYRADVTGEPIKSRDLSPSDLGAFEVEDFLVIAVLWDVDSLTVALRDGAGGVLHPAPVLIR